MFNDDVFLKAILANPADDSPWLIYSDWLEERDDPRAVLYRRPRFTNDLGMKFQLIPRGSFWMGEPGEQRQLVIPHEFYLGVYPVTQGQWRSVLGSNPSYFSRSGGGSELVKDIAEADFLEFPVERVSWVDVQEFLQKLNHGGRADGLVHRLPSEAEWEYSCRGGASSQADCSFDFYLPEPTNDLSSKHANFNGSYPFGNARAGEYLQRTSRVGFYAANRLRLYDMHGNVWEWCAELYESGGSRRVVRGGSWFASGSGCRAWLRSGFEQIHRYFNVGFRLAAVPSNEPTKRDGRRA